LLLGIGRGWPGGQLLSLLVQRKLTKESTPRFAALRVPNFFASVRAAAQLALRAQTVLAEYPRTLAKKLAAQKGIEQQTISQSTQPDFWWPVA
jgi:pimeloyl-CoA synthetase